MTKLEEFKEKWVGRKFKCKDTQIEFTIPECVFYKDFFTFGKCFVDVGDEYYARFGGNVEEVKDESVSL